MAEIVMFHHVQGLTDGVRELAARIAGDEHTVHLVDVFDGSTFDSIEDGFARVEREGFGTLIESAARAGEALVAPDAPIVTAGVSFGVLPAQRIAQTRPGVLAAILLEACVPASEFGAWPDGLAVKVHGMDDDEYFAHEGDIDAARELVASAADGELFTYPGDRHLFVDASLPSYDADATEQVVARARALLDRL